MTSSTFCLRRATNGNHVRLRAAADLVRAHNRARDGSSNISLNRSAIVRQNLRDRLKLVNGGGIDTDAGGVESINPTKSVFSPLSWSAWAMAIATIPPAEYPAIE